jgi:hypothetical protein
VAAASTSPLPNTGPADTLGIFALVSLAGYVIHRVARRLPHQAD